MMPKYLQKRFEKKGTTNINPEHKKFVEEKVKELEGWGPEVEGIGSKYDSEIGQGYDLYKVENKYYLAIHPIYYVIEK